MQVGAAPVLFPAFFCWVVVGAGGKDTACLFASSVCACCNSCGARHRPGSGCTESATLPSAHLPPFHIRRLLPPVWNDAVCYFKEQQLVRVGRPYGRVCRRRLREHLLARCAAAGVAFLEAEVEEASSSASEQASELRLADGRTARCRLAVLASGQAAGKLLRYEAGAPAVAAQTAYGIEAEVEGYGDAFPLDAMLFMDFRRHHTGLYDGTATK